MSIPPHITKILDKKSTDIFQGSKSNCFWATKYFFEPTSFPPQSMNGNEILMFMVNNFTQVDKPEEHDVFIIWGSSDPKLSPNKIDIQYLSTYPEGFPFGLVVEHSGVYVEGGKVFQKASPNEKDQFQVISKDLAFAPYEKLSWVRQTYHRKKL